MRISQRASGDPWRTPQQRYAAAAGLESQTVEEARRALARTGLDGSRVDVQLGDPVRQVLEVARGHDTALLVLGMPPPVRFLRLARNVGPTASQ